MDNIVNPTNTKLIAEWVGYKTTIVGDALGVIGVFISNQGMKYKYNPITNAEQSRELEKKLLKLKYFINYLQRNEVFQILQIGYRGFESETIELAIYKAALHEAKKDK